MPDKFEKLKGSPPSPYFKLHAARSTAMCTTIVCRLHFSNFSVGDQCSRLPCFVFCVCRLTNRNPKCKMRWPFNWDLWALFLALWAFWTSFDVCHCALINDNDQIHHPFKIGKTIPKALTLSPLPLCSHCLLSIASKRFLRIYIILHYSLAILTVKVSKSK